MKRHIQVMTNRRAWAQEADGAPADFDWKAYLQWHEDLAPLNLDTEAAARRHYVEHGRAEGRIYKHYRMIMFYSVCGGAHPMEALQLPLFYCTRAWSWTYPMKPSYVNPVAGHSSRLVTGSYTLPPTSIVRRKTATPILTRLGTPVEEQSLLAQGSSTNSTATSLQWCSPAPWALSWSCQTAFTGTALSKALTDELRTHLLGRVNQLCVGTWDRPSVVAY